MKRFQVEVIEGEDDWLDFVISQRPFTSDVWGDLLEQTTKLIYTTEREAGHDLTIKSFVTAYRNYYRQDFDCRKLHFNAKLEDLLLDIDKVENARFKKE